MPSPRALPFSPVFGFPSQSAGASAARVERTHTRPAALAARAQEIAYSTHTNAPRARRPEAPPASRAPERNKP